MIGLEFPGRGLSHVPGCARECVPRRSVAGKPGQRHPIGPSGVSYVAVAARADNIEFDAVLTFLVDQARGIGMGIQECGRHGDLEGGARGAVSSPSAHEMAYIVAAMAMMAKFDQTN